MACSTNTLSVCADKKGTYTIRTTLNGIPNTFNWKVSKMDGTEINTGAETPALIVDTTLSNTDLGIEAGISNDVERAFTISGTYNSTSPAFTNKPYTKECILTIKNYIGVANG